MTRDEVSQRVTKVMGELFELEASSLRPETRLIEELDLDSIDAIDLAAHLQELLDLRLLDEELRQVRTVDDVVGLIHRHVSARIAAEGSEGSS